MGGGHRFWGGGDRNDGVPPCAALRCGPPPQNGGVRIRLQATRGGGIPTPPRNEGDPPSKRNPPQHTGLILSRSGPPPHFYDHTAMEMEMGGRLW